jgi:hypothetical protein
MRTIADAEEECAIPLDDDAIDRVIEFIRLWRAAPTGRIPRPVPVRGIIDVPGMSQPIIDWIEGLSDPQFMEVLDAAIWLDVRELFELMVAHAAHLERAEWVEAHNSAA